MMLQVKPRLNIGLIQETRMNKEQLKEVQRFLKVRGYKLKMKKADDAAVIIGDEVEEVTIEQKDTLKYHIEPCLKHHINEARVKLKTGEVRVVSVYVPSTQKEKKMFVEQLTKALEVIKAEEELIIGGDFNMVEDNSRDSVAKRGGEARPVLSYGRRAQLDAEEKLMREMVEKHNLRDVFFSNDLKTYNNIYTNVTSNGEFNRRLDRIYITPRLFQSKLKFNHLSKFPFTTHHLIQLTLWIANVETGKPLYKIRPNITNNSNHVDFVTAFGLPDYSDVNLKLDVFCTKIIQRANNRFSNSFTEYK
ncbi:unnamed protein product [Ambrosiozyma monospora]|uniref:Unnamed protein product n=1 Tax=Ambrosiozyma monospora TaxID=43982 RepID=A0A9W6YQL5_AMBMO|nr:unnamed protein product [Ambrosiozyma monospora]